MGGSWKAVWEGLKPVPSGESHRRHCSNAPHPTLCPKAPPTPFPGIPACFGYMCLRRFMMARGVCARQRTTRVPFPHRRQICMVARGEPCVPRALGVGRPRCGSAFQSHRNNARRVGMVFCACRRRLPVSARLIVPPYAADGLCLQGTPSRGPCVQPTGSGGAQKTEDRRRTERAGRHYPSRSLRWRQYILHMRPNFQARRKGRQGHSYETLYMAV